jgi:diaminopimelate epimerase
MSTLRIIKGHGSLNDIFVIDGSPEDCFTAGEAGRAMRKLCDPGRGLDSKGAYFVADRRDGTADAWFFNPDGTTAKLCANGARVAGRILMDRHRTDRITLRIGDNAFLLRDAGPTPHGVRRIRLDMPPVDFTPAEPIVAEVSWPFVRQLHPAFHPAREVSALAVPNSHLISIVDTYDEDDLLATGIRVAGNPDVFPLGANVSFVQPLGAEEVYLGTYLRGCGLTPSCASSIAAARALLSRLGLADPRRRLLLRNSGGPAHSWLRTEGERWLPTVEGNATLLYRTEIDPARLLDDRPLEAARETFPAESAAFAALYEENAKALRGAGVGVRR